MDRIVNKELAFICPKCFRVSKGSVSFHKGLYDSFILNTDPEAVKVNSSLVSTLTPILTCKVCNERIDRIFWVDAPLGDVVAKFNRLGYRTRYSCAGHIEHLVDDVGIRHESAYNCCLLFDELRADANVELYDTACKILNSGQIPGLEDLFSVTVSTFHVESGIRKNISRSKPQLMEMAQTSYDIRMEQFVKVRDLAKFGFVEDAEEIQKEHTAKFIQWLEAIADNLSDRS